ncbi:hypothetical protein [Anaeromassilibacillus senegalensis]|uniref:hypothetical protein n=1 Tax=Anaeromassilibacillus senegalensis TaxID=1673717 RepID=UPI000681E097|nr:hypothetical protein [Anaeromassilibacillus senegalensis]
MKKWMAMGLITLLCFTALCGCGRQEPSAVVYRGGAAAPLVTLTADGPLDVLDEMLRSVKPAQESTFLPENADYEINLTQNGEARSVKVWLQKNRVYLREGSDGKLLVSTQVDAPKLNNLFEGEMTNV